MPRRNRVSVPGAPQLVLQQGPDCQSIFRTKHDRQEFIDALVESTSEHNVALHAFVLLPDSFVVLVTPDCAQATSGMMQSVGRRYVPYFNRTYNRRGSLWSGRYKTCLVEPGGEILNAYRYVELLPARRRLVASALDYPWSSARMNSRDEAPPWITTHFAYRILGASRAERSAAYATLLGMPLGVAKLNEIEHALKHSLVVGCEAFKRHLVKQLGIRVRLGRPGRPRRHAAESDEQMAAGTVLG